MHKLAAERGGECLSKEYINNYSKLTWRCKWGHQWDAVSSNIKQGTWCPACAGRQRGTIDEMRNLAVSRGGRCLSNKYINNYSKLEWRCKENHKWKAVPSSIKKGHWCPVCGDAQIGLIEDMRKIAKRRGGQCLSKEYTNNYSKLKFQCREGHKWEAIPSSMKRGFWCPLCASNAQKLTIEEMRQIAGEHGGLCLSKEYINNQSKLTWRCKEGHQWEAVPSSMKRRFRCPVCTRKK